MCMYKYLCVCVRASASVFTCAYALVLVCEYMCIHATAKDAVIIIEDTGQRVGPVCFAAAVAVAVFVGFGVGVEVCACACTCVRLCVGV